MVCCVGVLYYGGLYGIALCQCVLCWYVVYCVCLVWFGVLCSGVVGVVCVLCVVSRYVVLWVVVL